MGKKLFKILENYGFKKGEPLPSESDNVNLDKLKSELQSIHKTPKENYPNEDIGYEPAIQNIRVTFNRIGWYLDRIAIQDPFEDILTSDSSTKEKLERIGEACALVYEIQELIKADQVIILPSPKSPDRKVLREQAEANLDNQSILVNYQQKAYIQLDSPPRFFINQGGTYKKGGSGKAYRMGLDEPGVAWAGQTRTGMIEMTVFANYLKVNPSLPRLKLSKIPDEDKDIILGLFLNLELDFLTHMLATAQYGLPLVTSTPALNAQLMWHTNEDMLVKRHIDLLDIRNLALPYVENISHEIMIEFKEKYKNSLVLLRGALLKMVSLIRSIDDCSELDYELEKLRATEINPHLALIEKKIESSEENWRKKGYGLPIITSLIALGGYYLFAEPISFSVLTSGSFVAAFQAWWNSQKERKDIEQDEFFYLWQISKKKGK